MAKIERHILKDVQVERIALCDRGANRTPFRLMKRDAGAQEGTMSMFTKLFGAKKAAASSASVVAIAVDKSADKLAIEPIIKAAGYSVDARVETDDCVLYMQGDLTKAEDLPTESLAVKFDDALVAVVAGVSKDAMPQIEGEGIYLSPAQFVKSLDVTVEAMKSAADYTEKMYAALPADVFKFDAVLKDTRDPRAVGQTTDGAVPEGASMGTDKDLPVEAEGVTTDATAPYNEGKANMGKGEGPLDTAAKNEPDYQAIVKEIVDGAMKTLNDTYAKKIDDLTTAVEGLGGRIKKSEDDHKRIVATLKSTVQAEPDSDRAAVAKAAEGQTGCIDTGMFPVGN